MFIHSEAWDATERAECSTTNNFDLRSCGGFFNLWTWITRRNSSLFFFFHHGCVKGGLIKWFCPKSDETERWMWALLSPSIHFVRSYRDLSASTRVKPMFKQAQQESVVWFSQGSHMEENTNAIYRWNCYEEWWQNCSINVLIFNANEITGIFHLIVTITFFQASEYSVKYKTWSSGCTLTSEQSWVYKKSVLN